MASDTTSNLANALKRVYTDEVLDFFLSTNAEFWMLLERETKLVPNPIGSGYYWEIPLQSPQNQNLTSEAGAIPTVKNATFLQGSVTLAQFIGDLEVSLILEAVGREGGAWKNVMKREMKMCLDDMTKNINRIYAGTHGTGRVFVVNATTTATSCVGKLPQGTLLVRPNMRVEQYDADTSGSIVGSAFNITKIVPTTRTITVSASQTFTQDQGLYLAGSYGNAPNGIAGLVDDGTNLTTVHGNSRSTYEELKSPVFGNSGTVRNQTEELLLQPCFEVYQRSGASIDVLACNSGQIQEYLQHTRPDRRYSTSGAVPDYKTGFKADLELLFNGRAIPLKMCQDIAPRSIYGINLASLRRIGDQRPKWVDWGGGSTFIPGLATGPTYATSKVAVLAFLSNLACYQPNANFRVDDLSDLQLCGAFYGGSDT